MINLFTTYYISSERQKELDHCLAENLKNPLINQVYVFLDQNTNEHDVPFKTDKLKFIKLDRIPTYKDWIENASKHKGDFSIFVNADIYLNNSISNLNKYLQNDRSIVCLSRYEDNDGIKPHPMPKWSQDFWAIKNDQLKSIDFISELEIPTGKCRCDNRLAFIFTIWGWDIYNPTNEIHCFHKHKSNIRNYNKLDLSTIGGLAFVNPTKTHKNPSDIEISIMPVKTTNIKKCYLNVWLEQNLNAKKTH